MLELLNELAMQKSLVFMKTHISLDHRESIAGELKPNDVFRNPIRIGDVSFNSFGKAEKLSMDSQVRKQVFISRKSIVSPNYPEHLAPGMHKHSVRVMNYAL